MPLLAVLGNGRKRILAARARRNRCCQNPSRCRHNKRVRRNSLLPMIAGGVAAGVSGAVANRFLRNPSKSVRGYRVPAGSEGKIVRALHDRFVYARAEPGAVVTLATPSVMAAVMSHVFGGRKVSISKARSNGLLAGVAPDGTKYVVKKDREWDEWQVVAYVGGKRHEGRTYHASDKADAVGTFKSLVGGGVVPNRKRRVHRNPGANQNVITVPFRQGRKYSVAQVQNWVEKHGTPAMKKRFAQSMAQYRRFHKGSMPRFITYSLYKMGSHQGISDVEFGVSEGREWMAAYQVPKTSGKWMDKASAGRYVHAHGDSDIEVDIKRPVKLSKLPMRFHTPDGKAVGVIPSKNVKIGEWYEG